MGGKRKKKKKKNTRTVIILSIVIVVCVIVLIWLVGGLLKNKVMSAVHRKVTEQVMEYGIRQALESIDDPEAAARAKEIVDSIDEEDLREVEEIVEKVVNEDTVSDLINIVGSGVDSGSVEQVKDYLQENISEEDIRKLQELYNKYAEQAP